jgi:restriction endonuclease Mrr
LAEKPERIDNAFLRRFPEFVNSRNVHEQQHQSRTNALC